MKMYVGLVKPYILWEYIITTSLKLLLWILHVYNIFYNVHKISKKQETLAVYYNKKEIQSECSYT